MSQKHYDDLRESHESFYCPRGHPQHFTGESDRVRAEKAAKRAQELLDIERRRNTELREEKERLDRQRAAAWGQVTRLKNRAAAGLCPCCNRHFGNLARHMATKHPAQSHKPESVK